MDLGRVGRGRRSFAVDGDCGDCGEGGRTNSRCRDLEGEWEVVRWRRRRTGASKMSNTCGIVISGIGDTSDDWEGFGRWDGSALAVTDGLA